MEWRALVDPLLCLRVPSVGVFWSRYGRVPSYEIQQMIGWMPSSWKEKELEVDIRMNEMYMYKE